MFPQNSGNSFWLQCILSLNFHEKHCHIYCTFQHIDLSTSPSTVNQWLPNKISIISATFPTVLAVEIEIVSSTPYKPFSSIIERIKQKYVIWAYQSKIPNRQTVIWKWVDLDYLASPCSFRTDLVDSFTIIPNVFQRVSATYIENNPHFTVNWDTRQYCVFKSKTCSGYKIAT